VRFINLTGHNLAIYRGGKVVLRMEAEGRGYRLTPDTTDHEIVDDVDLTTETYRPAPLPAPEADTLIVVSLAAALGLLAAGIHRDDIVCPGPGVSDRGRVVGSRGFTRPTFADHPALAGLDDTTPGPYHALYPDAYLTARSEAFGAVIGTVAGRGAIDSLEMTKPVVEALDNAFTAAFDRGAQVGQLVTNNTEV
jgi:hypothetical protein